MEPNELKLMCQVLIEDSLWLDSFQASSSGMRGVGVQGTLALENGVCQISNPASPQMTQDHARHESGLCVESNERKSVPPGPEQRMNISVRPEVTHGSNSCVAAETFRMIKRAASCGSLLATAARKRHTGSNKKKRLAPNAAGMND